MNNIKSSEIARMLEDLFFGIENFSVRMKVEGEKAWQEQKEQQEVLIASLQEAYQYCPQTGSRSAKIWGVILGSLQEKVWVTEFPTRTIFISANGHFMPMARAVQVFQVLSLETGEIEENFIVEMVGKKIGIFGSFEEAEAAYFKQNRQYVKGTKEEHDDFWGGVERD